MPPKVQDIPIFWGVRSEKNLKPFTRGKNANGNLNNVMQKSRKMHKNGRKAEDQKNCKANVELLVDANCDKPPPHIQWRVTPGRPPAGRYTSA